MKKKSQLLIFRKKVINSNLVAKAKYICKSRKMKQQNILSDKSLFQQGQQEKINKL